MNSSELNSPLTSHTDEIWQWSAHEIAKNVRERAVSAEEVARACVNRIDQVNPSLNALVDLNHEETLSQARTIDKDVREGVFGGPLIGVPTATKINVDHAGYATSVGVAAWSTQIINADSPPVKNLKAAGHVFVGRSNCPAFASRWFTDSAPYGRTYNPWNSERTPGGSSGGAASAIASGMVPIAYGNDIGGSVRHPAFACGIFGIRPTVGLVPNIASVPLEAPYPTLANQCMFVQGPLARSIEDLRLGLDALRHPDLHDPFSFPVSPIKIADRTTPTRVGLMRGSAATSLSPEIDEALNAAAHWFEDAGYIVEEVEVDPLIEAWRLWWIIFMEEMRPSTGLVQELADPDMASAFKSYGEVTAEWWGEQPTLADYIAGYSRRGALITLMQETFDRYPLLLLPVSAQTQFMHAADTLGTDVVRELMAAQWSMMAIALLGLPAMSVPTGVMNGLPTGVQLLAGRFQEERLFEAGAVIESRVGRLTPITPNF